MNLYDIMLKDIDGNEVSLANYKGQVLLIVNVASKCGFTSQYKELETLHKQYSQQGLSILGFPCNQFLHQEPNSEKEIKSFCSLTYNVTFDMFSKIDVNGKNTHPLYKYLKNSATSLFGSSIKWNFTKFLVSKNGNVFKRYAPTTKPLKLEEDIQKLLDSANN